MGDGELAADARCEQVMLLFLTAAVAIPLGLDFYLPVPEENPLIAEKIDQGRQLFFDRRFPVAVVIRPKLVELMLRFAPVIQALPRAVRVRGALADHTAASGIWPIRKA